MTPPAPLAPAPSTFSAKRVPLAAWFILALVVALPSWAEAADGTIEGKVTDSTGAVLSGVKVQATGPALKSANSDREGRYRLSVPEGSYVVTAEKTGFVAFAATNLDVRGGVTLTQNIALEVARAENVTVEENAAGISLDATQNAAAIVLKEADLEALPDDPDELAAALQAMAGNSGGPNGGQIFVDGFSGGRIPSKASIREIRMNSNPFSSEFDRLGFGRIEIITRPGTDRFRGGGSWRYNSDELNTRNPFAPNKPNYLRNDFNADIAGPIVKGKASFSFDIDYRSVDDNDTINAVVLDSALSSAPFAQTLTRPSSRLSFSPRIDWQPSEKHMFTTRGSYSKNERKDSGIGGYNLPSRGFDTKSNERSFDATLNSIFGKRVNEIRFRYSASGRDQTAKDTSAALVIQDAFTAGGASVGFSTNDATRLELSDIMSWTKKNHAFRSGFRLRRTATEEASRNNFAGVVTFAGGVGPALDSNFNPVLGTNGQPQSVTLSSLDRFRRTLALQARGLSGAQIRALGGGATQYVIAGGNPLAESSQTDFGFFINDDWKRSDRLVLGLGLRGEIQNNIDTRLDLAPRFSWAYTIKKNADGRTPKTVTRGGLGIFYDRIDENLTLDANRYLDGARLQYLVTSADVLDSIRVSNTGVVTAPSASSLGAFQQSRNTRVVGDGIKPPRTIQASFGLEQQMGAFTGSLTVIGMNGANQLRSRNINALRADGTRPLGGSGAIYAYEATGRMNQLQLVTGLNSRPGRRWNAFVRYFLGWSKGDTDGAGSFPARPDDIEAEYGRASSDTRHRVMIGGQIELPGGVRLNPFIQVSSGRPYNITIGRDVNLDTVFSDRPAFADANATGAVMTEFGALNPSPGLSALIPRNYGEAPGFASVNLRFSKTIPFKRQKAATPAPTGQRPQGEAPAGGEGGGHGPGGPPMMMGGGGAPHGPMGGGDRGGGMGGGRGFGGGGAGITLSLNVSNLMNRTNPGTPVGNLSSPLFGRSTSLAGFFMGFGPGGFGGGGGGGEAGNRRIELSIRANF